MPIDIANADPAELARFNALAERWWDPHSEFRPLHHINPLRLEWIDALASLQGKRVLDVGCGGGILAEAMAARGADVLGIDMAPIALVELERFFAFNRPCIITVPDEHSELGEILGHDQRCMMLSHGQPYSVLVDKCRGFAGKGQRCSAPCSSAGSLD